MEPPDTGGPSGEPQLDVNVLLQQNEELIRQRDAVHAAYENSEHRNSQLMSRLQVFEQAVTDPATPAAMPAAAAQNPIPVGAPSVTASSSSSKPPPRKNDVPKLENVRNWRLWATLVFKYLSLTSCIVAEFYTWAVFGLPDTEQEWWVEAGESAFQGILTPDTNTWSAFLEILEQRFVDAAEPHTYLIKLFNQLPRGKTAFDLCTLIENWCRRLDFAPCEELKIHFLRRGISPQVATHVSNWQCKNFLAIREACTQVETSLAAGRPYANAVRSLPSSSYSNTIRYPSTPPRQQTRSSGPLVIHSGRPSPMELGAMTTKAAGKRPITNATGRYPLNSCFNCGGTSHFWKDCPKTLRPGLGRTSGRRDDRHN